MGILNDTVSVLTLCLADRVWLTGFAPGEQVASLVDVGSVAFSANKMFLLEKR